MEIKQMRIRIEKLTKILVKIAVMGLIMAGIILINKRYMSSAEGSEKREAKKQVRCLDSPSEAARAGARNDITLLRKTP